MGKPGNDFSDQRPVVQMITEGYLDPSNFVACRREFLTKIEKAIASGVGMIQIREKRLPAALLFEIAKKVTSAAENSNTAILVNERFDIAIAAGAHGVHLTSTGVETAAVRDACPDGFLIGISAHSELEVDSASKAGADYALFGPVFETPSKIPFGDPKGLNSLRDVCRRQVGFNVLAVGGINPANCREVLGAGAAGFAAIRSLNNCGREFWVD